jgi:hypothetical protein
MDNGHFGFLYGPFFFFFFSRVVFLLPKKIFPEKSANGTRVVKMHTSESLI